MNPPGWAEGVETVEAAAIKTCLNAPVPEKNRTFVRYLWEVAVHLP